MTNFVVLTNLFLQCSNIEYLNSPCIYTETSEYKITFAKSLYMNICLFISIDWGFTETSKYKNNIH